LALIYFFKEKLTKGFIKIIVEKSKRNMSKSDDNEDEEMFTFETDEIIWAKVRGFPWWPAKVSEAKKTNFSPILLD
jgi:hypothetical protein